MLYKLNRVGCWIRKILKPSDSAAGSNRRRRQAGLIPLLTADAPIRGAIRSPKYYTSSSDESSFLIRNKSRLMSSMLVKRWLKVAGHHVMDPGSRMVNPLLQV